MEKKSLIRTIYLYLFALVGLVLLIVGGVGLVNLGLKTYVFTQADAERYYDRSIPISPVSEKDIIASQENGEKVAVTEEQQEALEYWMIDYETWKKESAKVDYATANRQRQAANNLASIIIGLPLFLIHWQMIRKETKG